MKINFLLISQYFLFYAEYSYEQGLAGHFRHVSIRLEFRLTCVFFGQKPC